MANVHIVTSKIKQGHTIFDSTFSSQTVAAGSNSAVLSSTDNFVYVTALDAPVYIALATDGSANAATDPRIYIPTDGSVALSYKANTVIDVESA